MLDSQETLSWSLLWCQRMMVASMESKQTYYILHISYINSEISIGLAYIRPYFVWSFQLHHCTTLVRNLPTSILMLAGKFVDIPYILGSLWFYVFRAKQISDPSIDHPRGPSTHSFWLALHGKSYLTT